MLRLPLLWMEKAELRPVLPSVVDLLERLVNQSSTKAELRLGRAYRRTHKSVLVNQSSTKAELRRFILTWREMLQSLVNQSSTSAPADGKGRIATRRSLLTGLPSRTRNPIFDFHLRYGSGGWKRQNCDSVSFTSLLSCPLPREPIFD